MVINRMKAMMIVWRLTRTSSRSGLGCDQRTRWRWRNWRRSRTMQDATSTSWSSSTPTWKIVLIARRKPSLCWRYGNSSKMSWFVRNAFTPILRASCLIWPRLVKKGAAIFPAAWFACTLMRLRIASAITRCNSSVGCKMRWMISGCGWEPVSATVDDVPCY